LIDIENASKIQLAIKNWILGFFPKIQIGIETRVDGLHFVSWGLEFKKYHFCGEILHLEQELTPSQNILKIAYFVIRFFY